MNSPRTAYALEYMGYEQGKGPTDWQTGRSQADPYHLVERRFQLIADTQAVLEEKVSKSELRLGRVEAELQKYV